MHIPAGVDAVRTEYLGPGPCTGTACTEKAGTPTRFDIVTLATSAGGLQALSTVLRELPDDFPAAGGVPRHGAAALVRCPRRKSESTTSNSHPSQPDRYSRCFPEPRLRCNSWC
jgi:hypothetical protein